MKKTFFVFVLLFFSLTLFPQTEQHQVTVSNVVVPTRVFDGNAFINDLKIEDFELFEDGVLQKIEALYLTNKSDERKNLKFFRPEQPGIFTLFFRSQNIILSLKKLSIISSTKL
jgi:hypothetical protein